jgi:nucleoside-diphosphate-sugar epimerase
VSAPLCASNPTLLVIGCGDLGGAVASHFVERDWRVIGARRSTQSLAGVKMLSADITQPSTLTVLDGLAPDFVLFVLTPGEFTDARYRAVYVDGAKNCLVRIDASRLQRVFWVSSTSVYHQDDGSVVDEMSVAAPTNFSGKRLLEAEHIVRDFSSAHTIVRFGGIYGPGRDRLLRQLRAGKRTSLTPPRYSNRIHRDDAVNILCFLIERAAAQQPLQQLYLGVDTEPAPLAEIEAWFCGVLKIDYELLIANDAEIRGGNRRCNSARLQALDYRFIYLTYREGLSTLLGANKV